MSAMMEMEDHVVEAVAGGAEDGNLGLAFLNVPVDDRRRLEELLATS